MEDVFARKPHGSWKIPATEKGFRDAAPHEERTSGEFFQCAHTRGGQFKKLQKTSVNRPSRRAKKLDENWTKTGQNCPVFKVGRARVFRKISENLGITPLCQRLYVLVQRGFFEFFESVATEKIWEKMRVPKQQLPAHEG